MPDFNYLEVLPAWLVFLFSPIFLSILTYADRSFYLVPRAEFTLVDEFNAAAKNAPECYDLKREAGLFPCFELGIVGPGSLTAKSVRIRWM